MRIKMKWAQCREGEEKKKIVISIARWARWGSAGASDYKALSHCLVGQGWHTYFCWRGKRNSKRRWMCLSYSLSYSKCKAGLASQAPDLDQSWTFYLRAWALMTRRPQPGVGLHSFKLKVPVDFSALASSIINALETWLRCLLAVWVSVLQEEREKQFLKNYLGDKMK